MPTSVLQHIFSYILDDDAGLEELARLLAPLESVCKDWRVAARTYPLVANVDGPEDLADGPYNWLTHVSVGYIYFPRQELGDMPGHWRLFRDPTFRRHSVSSLEVIWHASLPKLLPVIHRYPSLVKLSLHCPNIGRHWKGHLTKEWLEPLHSLNKLTMLEISGYFAAANLTWFPRRLENLTLSAYGPDVRLNLLVPDPKAGEVAEPYALQHAVFKAATLWLDLPLLTAVCKTAHLYAAHLVLAMPGEHLDRSSLGVEEQLIRAVAQALVAGPLAELTLGFYSLFFESAAGKVRVPNEQFEADATMRVLRRELLPLSFDLCPALVRCEDFLEDRTHDAPCYVLEMARQPYAGPRSYHFTTPAAPEELDTLRRVPARALSWFRDRARAAMLSDPDFIAASRSTLSTLGEVELGPELDLTPFDALRTLSADVIPENVPGLRLPVGLTGLTLVVQEDHAAPADFDAGGLVSHIAGLETLSLVGFRNYDLAAAPASMRDLSILDPWLDEQNEQVIVFPIGKQERYTWPTHWVQAAQDARATKDQATEAAAIRQAMQGGGGSRGDVRRETAGVARASTPGGGTTGARNAAASRGAEQSSSRGGPPAASANSDADSDSGGSSEWETQSGSSGWETQSGSSGWETASGEHGAGMDVDDDSGSSWETASTSDVDRGTGRGAGDDTAPEQGPTAVATEMDSVSEDDWGPDGLRYPDAAYLSRRNNGSATVHGIRENDVVRLMGPDGMVPELFDFVDGIMREVMVHHGNPGPWRLQDEADPPETFWNRSPPEHICGAPGEGGLRPPAETACNDPHCFQHSKFRTLRVTVRDNRDVIAVDFDALIDSGAQLVSLEGFENYMSVCLLQHAGGLEQLAVRLHCSAVEAVEFHFGGTRAHLVQQGSGRGSGNARQLFNALGTLSTALEGRWTLKSIVDGRREDGIREGAGNYVMFRIVDKPPSNHHPIIRGG